MSLSSHLHIPLVTVRHILNEHTAHLHNALSYMHTNAYNTPTLPHSYKTVYNREKGMNNDLTTTFHYTIPTRLAR